MTLGSRIGRYRRKLGLTQEALAQQLEVTNQAVSKWESDICCPDISLLPKLADLFEITLDELFGRQPPVQAIPLPEPEYAEQEDTEPTPAEPLRKTKSLFEQLFHTTVEKVNQAVEKAEQELKNVEVKWEPAGGHAVPVPPAVEPDWEDDDTLRVVLFLGKRLIAGHPARRKIQFCYEGPAPIHIHSECSISCDCVSGNVTAGGDISCDSIGGSAAAGGDLTCDSVGGSVAAGGDVSCDSVGGSISASGDVSCDWVRGDIIAEGDVSCEDVGGDVTAGGDVDCGDVSGSIHAGGSVDIG